MFKFHKEGNRIILYTILFIVVANAALIWLLPTAAIAHWILGILSLTLLIAVLQFFRNPKRLIEQANDNLVYAPADGRVVVIEEVEEPEYFKDKRIQVSIFMSPTNVHVNRNPISGTINYFRYHAGQYLMAWNPKSSTDNERTTVVIDNGKSEILLRQIAGFMARRIVNYLTEGQKVKQGEEMGFIKFGSRVDVFLPTDAVVDVNLEQKVKGNRTVIARLIASE